jgi:hypothetical protein
MLLGLENVFAHIKAGGLSHGMWIRLNIERRWPVEVLGLRGQQMQAID